MLNIYLFSFIDDNIFESKLAVGKTINDVHLYVIPPPRLVTACVISSFGHLLFLKLFTLFTPFTISNEWTRHVCIYCSLFTLLSNTPT